MKHRAPLRALSALVVTLLALSACSGGGKKPSPSTSPSTTTATRATPSSSWAPAPAPESAPAQPTRTPVHLVAPAVNPLTGGRPVAGPVIAVKIDDTGPGRPQIAIDKADVVYIETAEGGLDRLIAVFGTNKPTVVGYVRSIRLTDPELLLQYGKITLAASGGAPKTLRHLKASGLPSWLMDGRHAYFRRRHHPNDHGYINVILNLAQLSKAAKTAPARNVGFVWNANPAGLAALPKATLLRTVVGTQDVTFRYDVATRRYVRLINGAVQHAADGKVVSTPNVIVQECKITTSSAVDPVGAHQHVTHTIGSGAVHVLRNGHVYTGTWSRKSISAPTVLRDAKGAQITLAPGGVWVALVQTKAPVKTS